MAGSDKEPYTVERVFLSEISDQELLARMAGYFFSAWNARKAREREEEMSSSPGKGR